MSPSPLSSKLTRSFGVLLMLLLFLVGFSMFNFRSLSRANEINIYTYRIITRTLELEKSLYSIDAGARGYIVTGDPTALASYRANLNEYDRRIAAYRLLTKNSPREVKQLIEALDRRKNRWVSEMVGPLVQRSATLPDPVQKIALAAQTTKARRRALQELQDQIGAIVSAEERLLAQRSAEQERAKGWTQSTLLLGSVFSVLLTAFLALFASKSALQLSQANVMLADSRNRAEAANAQLLESNSRLKDEIAARRAADDKLRRSVLDLRRSNAELEQFAYVASHDLQEPLRAVGGCVQVLQRRYVGKLDARADQFIQHSVDGVHRMQTLINDLLAYSRLGTKFKPFEPVEGEKIVAATLQNLSVAIQESGALITCETLPVLVCDSGQIEQVLQNLLSNAIKFRGEKAPQIHIGYSTRRDEWNGKQQHVLSVEDSGLGIEPQYFERIFVMFQRLHTRTEYAGTGIGLAVCKKIVERHGGKIWVESQPRSADPNVTSGSKFVFSLPFEPEDSSHLAPAEIALAEIALETSPETPYDALTMPDRRSAGAAPLEAAPSEPEVALSGAETAR